MTGDGGVSTEEVKDFSSEAVREKPEVSTVPYDPEPAREKIRGHVAYALIALLIGVVCTVAAMAAWAKPAPDLNQLTTALITPVVGLVGSVLGFYYAGKK